MLINAMNTRSLVYWYIILWHSMTFSKSNTRAQNFTNNLRLPPKKRKRKVGTNDLCEAKKETDLQLQ